MDWGCCYMSCDVHVVHTSTSFFCPGSSLCITFKYPINNMTCNTKQAYRLTLPGDTKMSVSIFDDEDTGHCPSQSTSFMIKLYSHGT